MNPDSLAKTDLGALLEAADPAWRGVAKTELEGILDELGAAITSVPPSAGGRPIRRGTLKSRAALLIGVAVIAVGSAVATGAVLSAHTGSYPTKAEVAMGGPGEALNPEAPDFRQVALEVASDIPYPVGYESWRDFLISDEIRTGGDGLVSTGALHGWFAASAYCAWVRDWRQADLAEDTAAAAAAASVISKAPSWRAVTDEDPHPDASVQGDGGFTQYTLFGWMLPYRQAVLAGDRGRVEHLLASGYGDKCWTSDPQWREQMATHLEWGSLSRVELGRRYELFLAGAGS
jgi:hypothetical protein